MYTSFEMSLFAKYVSFVSQYWGKLFSKTCKNFALVLMSEIISVVSVFEWLFDAYSDNIGS